MARRTIPATRRTGASSLYRLGRGELLGLLPRDIAERGYRLYEERCVGRILWTGAALEGELANPQSTVQVATDSSGTGFVACCSRCGDGEACHHAAATLLQWLDIRPTMCRMGPGSVWRSHSRHPFLAPTHAAADRVDLSHLTGPDLRSALELQLSLQTSGKARARLGDHEVEIRLTLPSGDSRAVVFSASLLPSALPLLRSLPSLRLDGELRNLELSEARLQPVLSATWRADGIALTPGYRLVGGNVIPAQDLDERIHGRWARIDGRLCRLLDPATPLVPYHRKGAHVLRGKDALRFLHLDHPQLSQYAWYVPTGQLASFRQPLLPKPIALEAELTDKNRVRLRPVFTVESKELAWDEVLGLLDVGFSRIEDVIVRAPDLQLFERVGFRLPKRQAALGLIGDRLALIRLLAETELEVRSRDELLKHLDATLRGHELPDLIEPPGLRSTLRPYQREGVAWMWSRYTIGIGALLADDMGLGKTHQVMGLLCLIRAEQPGVRFLVVCPRGVLEHWHHLLSVYAPDLAVHLYHGPDRSLRALPRRACVVLTTYDIVIRSIDDLVDRSWEVAVFDEAQRIKNPRTKAARAARKIESNFTVALSGTPLENRLLELWSVIDLILPGYLGTERDFRTAHRNPSHHQLHRLRQRLSVLTLRRLKEQVLDDLPEKMEDLRYCQLTPLQLELYRSIHQRQAAEILERLTDPSAEIPYLHIFALMTRLKQICDHAALVADGSFGGEASGKLEVLDAILDDALAGDHQVVVFSQYVTMINLLSRHLKSQRIDHLRLTGDTRERGRLVRRFNSGQHERVLLASLLAGGVGIDLTGASVVIHYDRWWNPAKENQATDRVHRMGQRRFVQVFKLVTKGTIEERIDAMIRSKTGLFQEVVAPTDEILHRLDRHQLVALLDLPPESTDS